MSSGRAPVRWKDRIQFHFSLGVVVLFLTMTVAMFAVIQLLARDILIEKNRDLISATGANIVADLSRKISLTETLTRSLARAGESLPKDPELLRSVIPRMLDLDDYQNLIAGGGIWPEPGLFTPEVERRSFFWGRDTSGQLQYFDQYNDPAGKGYHAEEWYVPTRYSRKGQCIWSKSYVDLYSLEPMATCTVAMFNQQQFTGNATVDIKLSGLRAFLQKASAELGGYAFAVDRNNKFLSFPNTEMSKVVSLDENNNQTAEFITTSQLAASNNSFKPFADILSEINQSLVAAATNKEHQIAQALALQSYQISLDEAALIAANISSQQNRTELAPGQISQVLHQHDLILNEPVLVSVFLMPETFWKIVVVTPQRMATASAEEVVNLVLLLLVGVMLFSVGLGVFLLRRRLIEPMYKIVSQLQTIRADGGKSRSRLLDESRPDEFGMLAYHFNQSTLALSKNNRDLKLQIKERKQAEHQLRHLALHDPLTGLPNRTLFQDRLQQAVAEAKRNQHQFALFFMDLDNFKIVNDTLGHEVGDELLKKVAGLLTEVDREVDTVARLGGDEFALIINDLICTDDAMKVAERIMARIRKPVNISNNDIQIGTSIGITVYPDDATDTRELLRNADIAMYQAKEDGRNTTRFYVDEMNTRLQNNKEILADLTASLANDEFELFFQPIFNIENKQLVSVEALIRWNHREKGMIPPDQFIPIAEQSGLINELGSWVLTQTCRQIKVFNDAGIGPIRIAINISPVQFRRDDFLEETLEILRRQGIGTDAIELEITEGTVMDNVDGAIVTMEKLHQAGFTLSIDDFGTGYSSLNYLKRFPIQKVKVDRSFVTDLESDSDNRAITTAIIQMGHSLGLKVLAEGVENEAQLNFLQAQNCDFVQGYYTGRPMPAAAIIEKFARQRNSEDSKQPSFEI